MSDSIVVGGGLVGALWSIFLARRGQRVTVLERRTDLRKGGVSAGRSINLAISERGLHALRRVGLEETARAHAIPMRGRMMHAEDGALTFQAYGKDDSQAINSISRGWLNGMLMDAAEATGRVAFRFGQRVAGVNFERGELSVIDEESGRASSLPASVLYGTDGAGSAVRAEMAKRPGFAESLAALGHGYKELILPAGPNGAFQIEKHALHIWPRGAFMLIALPNEDGSFTCTLFLPFEGKDSFAALKTEKDVVDFFRRRFPDALGLMPDLWDQFQRNPVGQLATLKSGPWNVGGRAVLLGDAAHAVVPFFGQGMNCGFEDCVALDALLEQPLDKAFEAFSRTRKTHSDAIADMAVENFVEMRDRVADPEFLLQKQVEKRLLNAFPGAFLSRYSLVSFSLAPYRFAYRVGEMAQGIVEELCHGLTRAEDVDLNRARQLIDQRLVPYVRNNEYGFGT
jgi:kynurenine 3-monooxygenase